MGTLASELGPHVETLTSQPRIYADANVPAGVLRHMRRRLKWDVLAVIEDRRCDGPAMSNTTVRHRCFGAR